MKRKSDLKMALFTVLAFGLALGAGCSGGMSGGDTLGGGPSFEPTGVMIMDPMDPIADSTVDPMPGTTDEETLVLYEMPETIYDSVIVPPWQTATLSGTTVEGNVYVMAGAVFYGDGVPGKGNVQAYMSSLVDLAQA